MSESTEDIDKLLPELRSECYNKGALDSCDAMLKGFREVKDRDAKWTLQEIIHFIKRCKETLGNGS